MRAKLDAMGYGFFLPVFHALEHDGNSGLEEVTVRNPDVADLPLRDPVLPGIVRAILELLDRVALGGDAGAVREAAELLDGRSLADARIDVVGDVHTDETVTSVARNDDFPERPRRSRLTSLTCPGRSAFCGK